MTLGENIHNAFVVVFETLKSIEKLMYKCRNEFDMEKYYMPEKRFMRWSSDQSWDGWIYWSFILLFQRKKDGGIMENAWINAPVYAVEINVDSDTCDTPKIYVAQMDFGDISDWSEGCSPSNHTMFYNAIHADGGWYEEVELEGAVMVKPVPGFEEKVSDHFWGFRSLRRMEKELTEINQDNYKEMIFGTIDEFAASVSDGEKTLGADGI